MADKNLQGEQIRKNLDTIIELNKTINLPKICDQLGIRYDGAKKILVEMGFTPRIHAPNKGTGQQIPDEVITEIICRLQTEQDSLLAIAKDYSYKYSDLYHFIRQRDPNVLRRKWSAKVRQRMGVPRKNLPDDEIVALYKEGKSSNALAEKYGVTNNTILKRLREAGVPLNDQSIYFTDERKEHQRKLANDGAIGIHAQGDGAYRFTKPERQFAAWCDEHDIGYTRQFQIHKGEHRYDFLIDGTKNIVEIDGVYWHSTTKQKKLDAKHESSAIDEGYTVIRFTDKEINETKTACFDRLITDQKV